jgi:hypothetical protein
MLSYALLAFSLALDVALLAAGIARHMPPVATDAEAQSRECCASRDQPGGTACVHSPRAGRERREVGR